MGRASARRDLEVEVAYVLEESCVCVLLVVMLGGFLFTAVSVALIARELLGTAADRLYSWAVNSTREELFSVPLSVDRQRSGQN